MTERRSVGLIGVIEGCTNPESAELLDDGETIVFGNCALTLGVSNFRGGMGVVYRRGESFISRARLNEGGQLAIENRRLVEGLTATLGCDVLRADTAAFPRGTVFHAAGGGPVTADGVKLVDAEPHVLIYDPVRGEVLGRLPLHAESRIGERFNGLEQPNGCAVDTEGNLFVTDIPNTNPDPDPAAPPPVLPAVYRIPADAIAPLIDGVRGSADAVQRVVMPGYVNGVTVSPIDGCPYAVSCSVIDPANGGLYRLDHQDFKTELQPPPIHRDLGVLDGVGITRRGTALVSNPLEGNIVAIPPGGQRVVLDPGADYPVRFPADFNVVYPRVLEGEPALLVPDIGIGSEPGGATVALLDISGL